MVRSIALTFILKKDKKWQKEGVENGWLLHLLIPICMSCYISSFWCHSPLNGDSSFFCKRNVALRVRGWKMGKLPKGGNILLGCWEHSNVQGGSNPRQSLVGIEEGMKWRTVAAHAPYEDEFEIFSSLGSLLVAEEPSWINSNLSLTWKTSDTDGLAGDLVNCGVKWSERICDPDLLYWQLWCPIVLSVLILLGSSFIFWEELKRRFLLLSPCLPSVEFFYTFQSSKHFPRIHTCFICMAFLA